MKQIYSILVLDVLVTHFCNKFNDPCPLWKNGAYDGCPHDCVVLHAIQHAELQANLNRERAAKERISHEHSSGTRTS